MRKFFSGNKSLSAIAGVAIFLINFMTISSLQAKETFSYKIMVQEKEIGKMIYEVEEENNFLQIKSFIKLAEEEMERDAQLTILRDTYEPLRSQKWVKLPGGEIVIETIYEERKAQIKITSPEGAKEATVSLPSPVFDSEEIPYLIGKPPCEKEKVISVLVPISGMVWRGKIQKIAQSEEEETFRFTLGGEITYLRYQKEKPRLVELQAPQRGYNLVLEGHSFPEENN